MKSKRTTIFLCVMMITTVFAVVMPLNVSAENSYPVLEINEVLTLSEGSTATLTSSILLVTDADNIASDIIFTIEVTTANGILKLIDSQLTPGNTFSQDDINNNFITYNHDGGETTSDSFVFTVSDGAGGIIPSTTFSISITPVNDPPLFSFIESLTVNKGAMGFINSNMLCVIDVDNSPSQIIYTIEDAPISGILQNNGYQLYSGDTFTQFDIDNLKIAYQHDGSQTSSDNFEFTVSDGAGGSIPSTSFSININIEIPNNPPVADAGLDQDVFVEKSVLFDGSNSYDPDGTIVSFDWDFGDFNTGHDESPTHEYSTPGIYTVTLIVTDDDGAIDSDSVTVTVKTFESATQDLISDVKVLELSEGIENSFVSKLDNAIKSIANDRPSAFGQLGAFINEVEAQRGKALSDAEADALIANAQWIIDNMSGG